jgi:hypothetical protein
LRLMDKISNGCKIEIDYTGTLPLDRELSRTRKDAKMS